MSRSLLSPLSLAAFVLTAAIGLALDQWSKVAAFERLSDGHKVALIPGWLEFQVTENRGAVFGIGQGQRWLFIGVSVAAIVFILYLFSTSGRQRIYQMILGMLMAGVLGNLYDRVQYGYVRDMIHALSRWPSVFPWIFNVADSLLCVGVGLMIVYSFLHGPEKAKQPQPA